MLKSSTDGKAIFKWEVKVGTDIFELSDASFQKLLQMEQEGKRLVKIGDKVINPAFITSSKKVYKNPINNFVDWSALEAQKEPTVSKEVSERNRQKIMDDIRKMLKEKNKEWKPSVKDEQHRVAIDDVWEHLKEHFKTLQFPLIDDSWKADSSIVSHNEGRESHPVSYFTKQIDLGDGYDNNFWAEANYIFCNGCNKYIRKQIILVNNYDSDLLTKEF